jgi:hypothetical protein
MLLGFLSFASCQNRMMKERRLSTNQSNSRSLTRPGGQAR